MFADLNPVTQLSLNRLSRDQVRHLVSSVFGPGDEAERYIDRIVERADGNPLYVEELAWSAKASVNAGTEEIWSDAEDPDTPLPERLQTLLEARLDRLAYEDKALTEAASVIGQEFEVNLLAQLLERRKSQMTKDAGSLVLEGIFSQLDWDPPGHYRFRHALLQQAAYANVLRGASTNYHRRLIELLRTNDPDIDAKSPETIAHHLTQSGQLGEAAKMWLHAARAARDTGSNLEALGRLDHGYHRVVTLLDPPDPALRMAYLLARGEVINAHYGPVRPDARLAFEEAAALAKELHDPNGVAAAHTELFHLFYVQANFQAALASSDILIKQPDVEDQPQAKAMGYLGAGMCRFALGEFDKAKTNFELSIEASSGQGDASGSYISKALIYLALINQFLGKDKEATSLCDEGKAIARKQNALIVSAALGNSLYLDYMQSRPARVLETTQELLVLAEQKGFVMWYYQAQFWRGWALSLAGDTQGLRLMEESMERFFQAEEIIETTIFFCAQSEAYWHIGDLEDAEICADRGLDMVCQTGERFYEVPLLRQKIACLKERSPAPMKEITKLSTMARSLAREQGAEVFFTAGV